MKITLQFSLKLSLKISWHLGKISETQQIWSHSKVVKCFQTTIS